MVARSNRVRPMTGPSQFCHLSSVGPIRARVAQSVEHSFRKAGVASSILASGSWGLNRGLL